jgi:glutathione synthase/RimK-type ligase-like ATP-grasp enzyme
LCDTISIQFLCYYLFIKFMKILMLSPKNAYATKRLKSEANKLNLELEVLDVDDIGKQKIHPKKHSALYIRQFYPRVKETLRLIKLFKKHKRPVIDETILEENIKYGKLEMYKKLNDAKIPIPKTYSLKPNTCTLSFPYVLKWIYGFGKKGFYVIKNENDFREALKNHPQKEYLVQEYIGADYEYKVIVVGFKALLEILRVKYSNLKKTKVISIKSLLGKRVGNLAQKAAKAAEREMAKVDILQKGKKFYVLEVNRTPGLSYFESKTKFNVAKRFVEYLK